jgi:DNA-binding NarL/FixJ family response regulator
MSVPGGSKRGGTAPIRLIVADDHPLWRDTLRGLLEHDTVATVVAEASTGDEAVAMAESVDADVILLDINMPRMNGIDAARAISEADSSARILMLSSLTERAEVLASVRAGASGYLLKTAGREEVTEAVRRIYGGELVFPSELTNMVLAELRKPSASGDRTTPAGLRALTARENDVLRLIAAGASNHRIAKHLHLAAKTVEAHIASIFTKLGLEASGDEHRRVQAAVKFLRESRADES